MARFGRGFPTPFRYRIGRVGPTPTFTRSFNSTSDNITCAIGSLADFRDGNMTVGAIIKLTDTTDASVVAFMDTGDPTPLRCSLAHGSTIPIGLQDNAGGAFVGPPPTLASNVWCVAVVSRSAGVLRAHVYNFDTATWTHASGATVNGVNETLNQVLLGGSSGFGFFGGRMAVAGAQAGTAFSDVQIETLNVGLQEWVDLFTAGAVWRLDQDSTATAVPDIVGTADQTAISGTSVVADSPAGFDWSLAGGTVATAETATVTVAAQDATVAVAPNAETAAVIVAAQDAVAAVGPVAQTATATAAAQDAVAVTTTGTVAVAETATVTAAAQDATIAVAPIAVAATVAADADAGVTQAVAVEAETATVTAAAQDATAVVVSGGVAGAQTATVIAAAQDATIAVVAMAQTATVTAAAVDAVATVGPAAETALVAAAAADATIAVAQPAGTATVTAAAQDATASTVATTTAIAETATVTAAAQDATAAIAPVAQTATATVAAQDAVFQRFTEVIAQTALVTAAAIDATAAIGVLAETAAVIAAAQDATFFIPPPVPPPRWVEGGPTASGLVEHAGAATGQVEGVLVGAGIVEGGASL